MSRNGWWKWRGGGPGRLKSVNLPLKCGTAARFRALTAKCGVCCGPEDFEPSAPTAVDGKTGHSSWMHYCCGRVFDPSAPHRKGGTRARRLLIGLCRTDQLNAKPCLASKLALRLAFAIRMQTCRTVGSHRAPKDRPVQDQNLQHCIRDQEVSWYPRFPSHQDGEDSLSR